MPKTITENGASGKRSSEWSNLKTILFENAVFQCGRRKLSEDGDVIKTDIQWNEILASSH